MCLCLTHLSRLPIVKLKRRKGAISVTDKLVKALETKVNDLSELSMELKLENQGLKKRLTDLQHEKRNLLEKQRRASDYVDRSINRLKSIENSQQCANTP